MKDDESKSAVASEVKNEMARQLKQVNQAREVAETAPVVSPEDYDLAGKRLALSRDRRQYLEERKDEVCIPMYRAHKATVAEFKPGIDGWKMVETILGKKMDAYDAEQEKLVKERQHQLRLIAAEEADREAAELKAMADAAESRGEEDEAQELREDAQRASVIVPIPMIPQRPQDVEELKTSKRWSFDVIDLDAVPDEYCRREVLGEKVRAEAKRTQGKCVIPGIAIKAITVRSRK